jgi:hypothetical protein
MNNDTKSKIAEKIRQYPNYNNQQIRDCLRRLGVKCSDVAEARLAVGSIINAASAVPSPRPIGRNVASLLGEFDELAKVRAVMKTLPKSAFLEDDEMRTTANVPLRSWNAVKGHATLAHLRYKLPNQKFVWMHPSAQADLTAAINLSQT